jgi:hypothetical protein
VARWSAPTDNHSNRALLAPLALKWMEASPLSRAELQILSRERRRMARELLVRRWTDTEVDELRRLWGVGVAPSKIARRLRRVESGIKNKAREIGLPAKLQPYRAQQAGR